jgi:hypothetical protein
MVCNKVRSIPLLGITVNSTPGLEDDLARDLYAPRNSETGRVYFLSVPSLRSLKKREQKL